MGSSEIDKENIITATMEELTEEERKAYLVAEEHLREHFLQGFKKERGGLVKRVGEFVMPSFKLNQDMVEVLPIDPSELVKQFSLMVDSKISDAQVAAGETLAGLNDEIAALKKGKTVESGAQFTEADSAGTSFTQDQFYGMPPNSFLGKLRCHLLSMRHRCWRSDRLRDRSDRSDGTAASALCAAHVQP